MSTLRPSQRGRVAFSTSQDAFEKRLYPSRQLTSKHMEKGRLSSLEQSEFSGWGFMRPQRSLRRNRTVCDFSAHIKYCHDEELKSSENVSMLNFISPSTTPIGTGFEDGWLMNRSRTVGDFSSSRKYSFDSDNTTIDDQHTDDFDTPFMDENLQNIKAIKPQTITSLWKELNYLRLNEPDPLIDHKPPKIISLVSTTENSM